MSALSKLQKLEEVAACGVPCALHALSALTPTPPGAEVWEGACIECGAALLYHSCEPAGREHKLFIELFSPGASLDTLTTSRRSLTALYWVSRRGKTETAKPAADYERALSEEHGRRMDAKWAAHLATMSDELLEVMADLAERDPPDAEPEAIIWPGGGG